MMRRESRSFVVERRRGQKRAPVVTTIEQPQQSAPIHESGLDEIFRRAEAALFDRGGGPQPKPSAFPSENGASHDSTVSRDNTVPQESEPKRRILENLNEVDPLTALLAERGEASRRGRKPGSKNKPKDPATLALDPAAMANLKGRMELTPERINEALKAMERVSASASARGVKPVTVGLGRPVSNEVEEDGVTDERLTIVEQSTEHAVSDTPIATVAEARPRERATIRGRYVVGSELKPGERWKRRLRGAR